MSVDGRIPLLIVDDCSKVDDITMRRRREGACLDMREGGGDEGWLIYHRFAPAPVVSWKHDRFCVCCAQKQPVPAALTQLFMDRVRGIGPYFSFAVLYSGAFNAHELGKSLQQEVLVSARYQI